MQNIINFDNSIIRNGKVMLDVSDAIRDKQISIGTIYELLGYAENEANIPAIRKAVAAVRNGKILPTSSESEQKKNNRLHTVCSPRLRRQSRGQHTGTAP